MNIKSNSQNNEVQKQFDLLIMGNVFYSFLCWFGLLILLAKEDFAFWTSGVVITTVGVLLYVIFTLLKYKILSPTQFHLSIFILSIPNGLLLFDASLKLMIYSSNLHDMRAYLLIIINVLLTTGGIVGQIFAYKERLKGAIDQNIRSGRLKIKNGLWDLSAPLHFGSNESKKSKRLSRLSRLSPIVTAITFIFARTVEGKTQIMVAAIALFIVCISNFWGYARHLAIAMQIQEWQKIYKIKINLC